MQREENGTASRRPWIGVSACLLGQAVRYDGGHKLDRLITDGLGRYFGFCPVCPEVGIGMGVPRPPIHLVLLGDGVHARGVDDPRRDVSQALRGFARETLSRWTGVSGFIFKQGSPSCGLDTVLHDAAGQAVGAGRGLFAEVVTRGLPALPVAAEGQLSDPVWRAGFIERVFVFHHWLELRARGLSRERLRAFHGAMRPALSRHDADACQALDEVLMRVGDTGLEDMANIYLEHLMRILQQAADRVGVVNLPAGVAAGAGHDLD